MAYSDADVRTGRLGCRLLTSYIIYFQPHDHAQLRKCILHHKLFSRIAMRVSPIYRKFKFPDKPIYSTFSNMEFVTFPREMECKWGGSWKQPTLSLRAASLMRAGVDPVSLRERRGAAAGRAALVPQVEAVPRLRGLRGRRPRTARIHEDFRQGETQSGVAPKVWIESSRNL